MQENEIEKLNCALKGKTMLIFNEALSHDHCDPLHFYHRGYVRPVTTVKIEKFRAIGNSKTLAIDTVKKETLVFNSSWGTFGLLIEETESSWKAVGIIFVIVVDGRDILEIFQELLG